jgi:outer membrane autotransporter protein
MKKLKTARCLIPLSLITGMLSIANPSQIYAAAPEPSFTWNGSINADWNTGDNWSGKAVPGESATATFKDDGVGQVNVSSDTSVGKLVFENNTGNYTLNLESAFTVQNGIQNNGNLLTINISDPNNQNNANMTLSGGAISGNIIINNEGSALVFTNNVKLGNAKIYNYASNSNGGQINFYASSNAQNAIIQNIGDSTSTPRVAFRNNSNADHATLINKGGEFRFVGDASVTDVTLENDSGVVDFTALANVQNLNLAALSGGGSDANILLGNNNLTVGDGNTNTVYDGNFIPLVVNNDTDYAPPIFSSSLTKIGTGSLTLNGENYISNVSIEQGTLVIGDANHTSASITSSLGSLSIQSAGTLEGYGTINGNVTNNGTISPGGANAIGTLTINGNYTQSADATYLAQIGSNGASDKLVIHGTAVLNGGYLNITALNQFAVNTPYTILTANSIQGGFTGIIQSPFLNGNFTPSDGKNISYIINYNPTVIDHSVETANQKAVADYILATDATRQINGAISGTENASQFRALMDQLSGATYANQTLALAEIGNWFDIQLDNHQSSINLLPANDPTLWVTAQQGFEQLLDSDVSGLNTHLSGVAIGSDFALSNATTVGVGLGLTKFDESATDQETASTNGDLYQLGAYIHHAIRNWRLGAELSYGFVGDVNSKRTIATTQTTGGYHANVWSARGNLGYLIPLPSADYHVQPYTGVIGQRVDENGFTENSNTGFELHVDPSAYQSLRSQLGVSAEATPFTNKTITLFTDISWEHEFADTRGEFNANFVGLNNSFTIVGTEIGRDAAVIQAGIKLPLYKNALNLTAAYQGRMANNLRDNLVLLQFAYSL